MRSLTQAATRVQLVLPVRYAVHRPFFTFVCFRDVCARFASVSLPAVLGRHLLDY